MVNGRLQVARYPGCQPEVFHVRFALRARKTSGSQGSCETARQAFLCATPRYFDFLDCETETSKCLDRERETFKLRFG